MGKVVVVSNEKNVLSDIKEEIKLNLLIKEIGRYLYYKDDLINKMINQ